MGVARKIFKYVEKILTICYTDYTNKWCLNFFLNQSELPLTQKYFIKLNLKGKERKFQMSKLFKFITSLLGFIVNLFFFLCPVCLSLIIMFILYVSYEGLPAIVYIGIAVLGIVAGIAFCRHLKKSGQKRVKRLEKKEKAKKELYDQIHDAMQYDFASNTLTVKKLIVANDKALKYKELTDYELKHHDAKYVYTSATVGGITTGGVHKIGDYDTINATSTGKYAVYYKTSDKKLYPVKTIHLANELVVKAKKDPVVKNFLHNNILVLEKKVEDNTENVELAIKHGNMALAMQLIKNSSLDKQLTKQECRSVINWICGVRDYLSEQA